MFVTRLIGVVAVGSLRVRRVTPAAPADRLAEQQRITRSSYRSSQVYGLDLHIRSIRLFYFILSWYICGLHRVCSLGSAAPRTSFFQVLCLNGQKLRCFIVKRQCGWHGLTNKMLQTMPSVPVSQATSLENPAKTRECRRHMHIFIHVK